MGCASSRDAAVSSDPWELASKGQARQLERWLEMGGNPSALDRQGGRGTLLHAAAQHDQVECIRVLLRNGADVNAVTKLRGSPLHAAAMHSTGVSVRVLLDSGADPLLKNAEGRSAIDVAVANGYANLARLMRDTANQQAAKRREASSQHLDGLPRTSAQQQRGQHGMQPRVSGAFGYPEWNATSSMAQPQPGQQRFRGLPSEMMTLATQQGQQAQQAQPQARVSPLPEPQPRVSPQPVAVAVETAQAADGMPRPSPFDQEAGQAAAQAAALRATPPATPPRGSPGGVTPSTSSNNLAKQPTTAEAYLAQFREAASQGQGGSGEQRQASAGAASGLPSSRQLSAASSSGAGDAPEAVPPHLVRNAGGVPAWWLGPQPSLGPGQSPRHGRAISQPTIQEGVPLDGASVGNGGPAGHGPHAGEQQQQDFNTGSSSTSGGSSSLLLTDPLLNWVNTHMKQAGAAGAPGAATPAPLVGPERSTSVASGSSNILSGASNMSSGLLSNRSTMVDIKPWEISYDDLVIQRPIGEGSFGKVYLAKWNETLVAVKLLLSLQDIQKVSGPEAALTLSSPVLFNLQKECQLMAGMRHPNIVQFMGVSAMPPAMVTEYCGKGSLTDVLRGAVANPKQAQMLTWARRLNLALDAAKGMLYLHRRGIIHRDLKSPNLLVDSTWRVKIADFNLSKIIDVDGQNAKTGTMAGANPKWLAPEVIAGQPATVAGDVFSFGVVLWELLTWAIPWQRQSPWTVVAQVLGGKRLAIPDAEHLPGTPADNSAFSQQLPSFVELIQRCWAQDPAERPEFDEIIKELRKFCEACVPQRIQQAA